MDEVPKFVIFGIHQDILDGIQLELNKKKVCLAPCTHNQVHKIQASDTDSLSAYF